MVTMLMVTMLGCLPCWDGCHADGYHADGYHAGMVAMLIVTC
jgi:hypothetical protein